MWALVIRFEISAFLTLFIVVISHLLGRYFLEGIISNACVMNFLSNIRNAIIFLFLQQVLRFLKKTSEFGELYASLRIIQQTLAKFMKSARNLDSHITSLKNIYLENLVVEKFICESRLLFSHFAKHINS